MIKTANFDFYAPTKVVFGKGSVDRLGALVKAQGCSKVLIHYGGKSAIRSGLIDRVRAALDAEGIGHVSLIWDWSMKVSNWAKKKASILSWQSAAEVSLTPQRASDTASRIPSRATFGISMSKRENPLPAFLSA